MLKDHVGFVLTIPIVADGKCDKNDKAKTTNLVAPMPLTIATGCDTFVLMPLLLITDAAVGESVIITDSIVPIYLVLDSHDDEK